MKEPLSSDGNEITDKGYVNQRAVLERRSDLVDRLYAATADAEIITAWRGTGCTSTSDDTPGLPP